MDMEYVTCPLCGDDVKAPTDPTEQAEWLKGRAAALLLAADEIESGSRGPLVIYGRALD